jgi:serine/threonine protein kinase
MPHLPLGSLKDEHRRNPLAEGETVDLLFQGLTVLEYLHSRGVAYRDLKPENILVERRSPLHLRFADFGMASDQPDLKTFCGTELYVAPEILKGGDYTTAVDVWSLGVIVLEYMYGLPLDAQVRKGGEAALRERGLAWCRRLVDYTNDWDSDPLIDLLTTGMLRIEPRERFSADLCLAEADGLGLLDKPSTSSGGTTPTRTMALTSAVRNEEETPTVITGALSDAGRERGNHDDNDNDQAGRSASDHLPVTSTSHQLGVSGSQSGEGALGSREGTPQAVPGRSSDLAQSSTGPLSLPEARSISKRHRSPAISLPSNPSDESRVKRRPRESRFSKFRASGSSKLLSAPSHDGEVISF